MDVLREALVTMRGLPAWGAAVGVGSFLTVDFGSPITTSTGSTRGQFHLWVFGASWVIRQSDSVIANSDQDHDAMLSGARSLNGAYMRTCEFVPKLLALHFYFDQGRELELAPLSDPEMEEWFLYLHNGSVVTAGPEAGLSVESASEYQLLRDDPDECSPTD